MTELELLFYVSWSCLFISSAIDRAGTLFNSFSEVFWGFVGMTLFLGLFHQLLKTIFFRISWGG